MRSSHQYYGEGNNPYTFVFSYETIQQGKETQEQPKDGQMGKHQVNS